MSNQLGLLLSMLPPAAVTVALRAIIRRNGPQGFVHGLGDWSGLDDVLRQRVGGVAGNFLCGMAALIAGFGVFGYIDGANPGAPTIVGLVLVSAISALPIGMLGYLVRMQRIAGEARHER